MKSFYVMKSFVKTLYNYHKLYSNHPFQSMITEIYFLRIEHNLDRNLHCLCNLEDHNVNRRFSEHETNSFWQLMQGKREGRAYLRVERSIDICSFEMRGRFLEHISQIVFG